MAEILYVDPDYVATDYVLDLVQSLRPSAYQPVLGSSFIRNPTADPLSHLRDEIYFVTQKTYENRLLVEFELGSALDLQGVMLPRRQIMGSTCGWRRYRGEGCGYSGGPVADRFDNPTSDPAQDNCSRSTTGCKLRFGDSAVLPFGGFPGANLSRQ